MKVLVVNQDPQLSLLMTSALVGEDEISLLEVRTPERALQQLDDAGGFDLVLADADTAPTGGFALAREVKTRAKMGRDVPPVVLLLARSQDRYLAKWSEADAFLLKPADPFDLHAVITAVVTGGDIPDVPGVGWLGEVPEVLGVPEGAQGSGPRGAGY